VSGRLRSLLVLLTVLAMLAVPAAALAAKTKVRVEPASTSTDLTVRGTNGWRIQITAGIFGRRLEGDPVGVYAKGPHHEEVEYQHLHGSFTRDGSIEAKLPGVGRIDLRYEPTAHHITHIETPNNCISVHTAVDSSGVFRGTIELHGEGGYTTVNAHSARGSLSTFPKQTCRVRVRSKEEIKAEIEAAGEGDGAEIESLDAFRKLAGGTLTFSATSYPISLASLPPHQVDFTATYFHRHDGMWVSANTSVEAKKAEGFTLSPSTGIPSEAMVEPPSPFAGSAKFTLPSPPVGEWTGDLRATVPTLGTVDLAGPEFKPLLCDGNECTGMGSYTHVTVTSADPFAGNFFPG
jgi:hypothetical protein